MARPTPRPTDSADPAKLRRIGWAVSVAGGVAAIASYWVDTHAGGQVLDDTTALGYSRSLQHGVGVMMGNFGTILTDWQATLTSPLGKAILIVVCAALFAAYFFRVAWVTEQESGDHGNGTAP